MKISLSNGEVIEIDPGEVHMDPRAGAIKNLEERKMKQRDLADYESAELYAFKNRLTELRRSVRGKRGPGPSHTRHYCDAMRKKVNAELKRRGLSATRPGDCRVYGPGCAGFQRAGAREVAA